MVLFAIARSAHSRSHKPSYAKLWAGLILARASIACMRGSNSARASIFAPPPNYLRATFTSKPVSMHKSWRLSRHYTFPQVFERFRWTKVAFSLDEKHQQPVKYPDNERKTRSAHLPTTTKSKRPLGAERAGVSLCVYLPILPRRRPFHEPRHTPEKTSARCAWRVNPQTEQLFLPSRDARAAFVGADAEGKKRGAWGGSFGDDRGVDARRSERIRAVVVVVHGSLRSEAVLGSCGASVSTSERGEIGAGEMSGGNTAKTDDDPRATLRGDSALQELDQEMKDDSPQPPSQASVACGANASSPMRRGIGGPESTWNFVQMNMTLLPIARPLPVNVTSRLQDGFYGGKPRTPNQKLHRRVLQNASNISPRRNEDSMLRRRGSTSSESGTAASLIPRQTIMERQFSAPTAITGRAGKRKSDYDDHYVNLPWPGTPTRPSPGARVLEEDSRVRSASEDLSMHSSHAFPLDAQLEGFMLSRSASTSSALAQPSALFKDKRILELQDEERRLQPDERASLPSPSKRSRHQ